MLGLLFLLMLIASAACMLGLVFYSRRFASNPAALPFQLLMICASFWSLLYAMDLSTSYLPAKIFWQQTRFIFLPFAAVMELWLVLAFLKRDFWISGWKLPALCIIPCISVILAMTGQYHPFFRYNYELIDTGLLPILKVSTGPFYTLHLVYTYCLITISLILLVVIRDETHRAFFFQRILLFLALLIPVISAFIFDVGITSIRGINPTPALFWILGILYAIALFRYGFLDIIPVARTRVIEEMGMPMMVLDSEGKIIDINPAADHLLRDQYHGKRIMGQSLIHLVPDWDDLIRFCSNGEQGTQEIIRKQDDDVRTYEARADMIFSNSGSLEARVILLTDITKQKNLEQELRESESRWRSIIDGAPFPVVITRIADSTILFVNQRTVNQFHIPYDELVGRNSEWFYVNLNTRDSFMNLMKGLAFLDDIEMEMQSPDGRKFWVYASVRKIQYLGDEAFFISFADFTQRKKLEQELRDKNADLEMISRTLNATNKKLNLLSSITRHDILNNVQVIVLATDELMDFSGDPEHQKNTTLISEAGRGIQGLIGFTAEYQTLGETKPVWQDITTIITNPIIHRLLFGVSLEIPSIRVEIFADLLLEKVFYNLVDNSIRHGGHVRAIRISTRTLEKALKIIYEDDGVGIPYADKKKIFTRGYGKNTGLGLFFIREILDITGMEIIECGKPGEGVRFEILVPEGEFRIVDPAPKTP